MQESLNVTGHVHVQLFDENGKLKQEHEAHNLIVTTGKTALATWLAAATQAAPFMPYVGLGTGSTSPVVGNTALETELAGGGYSRPLGVITSSGNAWQSVTTFAPGNGTAGVTEVGLFSASTTGTMCARQVFGVYNKSALDTLIITWDITFS